MRHFGFVCLFLAAASVAQTPAGAGATRTDAERTVAGRVVDESGKPLADVAVCVLTRRSQPFLTKELKSQPLTTTGADGRYEATLPDEVGKSGALLFVGRGRVHVTTPLDPHDGWPVVLSRAHTLAGRVVDQDGKPVAGARVEARDWLWQARYRAQSAGLEWLPMARTAVRTDARGRFVVPGTVASGVQLIVGEAFHRSFPVALGEPIELVMPTPGTIHEDSPRRPRWRPPGEGRRRAKANTQKDGDDAVAEDGQPRPSEPVDLAGSTGLEQLPVAGLSLRIVKKPKPAAGGLALGGMLRSDVSDYFNSIPVAADGTFAASIVPGEYLVELIVPRLPRQGAPDVIETETVTITPDQKTLALDLGKYMPVTIRGTVRGFVPSHRMLVGASVRAAVRGHYYGYANYESPLAPVAPDGSFTLQAAPGECTVYVIDLLSGMMLHREGGATYETGDTPVVDMAVRAGACDVRFAGDIQLLSWLEMIVPEDLWPKGIDRMSVSHHEYTKRIGCILPPGTDSVRLYLPPCDFELWYVADDQGDLRGDKGEASVELAAGKVEQVSIEIPKR